MTKIMLIYNVVYLRKFVSGRASWALALRLGVNSLHCWKSDADYQFHS